MDIVIKFFSRRLWLFLIIFSLPWSSEMCYSLILFVILLNLWFVNLNSCSKTIAYLRLMLIQNEIIFVIIPLLTVKIGKPPNLASITVHFGLYNNFLPVIFTLLFCFQRASRSCFSNFISQIYVMIHEI